MTIINLDSKLKNLTKITLINIGEPIPIDGNRLHRMSLWKCQLENNGYIVEYITTDFEHQRKRKITSAPNGYILLKSYLKYQKNISLARLLNHFLVSLSLFKHLFSKKFSTNIIIVSYPTIWMSFIAVLYGKYKKIKVIVDVRDKWPDIFISNNRLKFILKPLIILKNYIFDNCYNLITISPGYLLWAKPGSEINTFNILPLIPQTVSQHRRAITLPINLLFVGSLGETYDLDLIYKINDNFQNKHIPFTIWIAGDGPRLKEVQKNIKDRINIKLLGWLNEEQLLYRLSKSHFGLMLYYENSPQGWPNKLIEYMANGLPILNSLSGESWDLIKKQNVGFNFSSSTIDELSMYIIDSINNPTSYLNLVQNCHETINSIFSIESNLLKLKNIIES